MSRKLSRYISIFVVSWTAGCVPLLIPTQTRYPTLRARVVEHGTGLPVEGAIVDLQDLYDGSATTDREGYFVVSGFDWDLIGCIPLVPAMRAWATIQKELTVSKPGYQPMTTTVSFHSTFVGWHFCGNGGSPGLSEWSSEYHIQKSRERDGL